jgi:hypothetical protein
LALLGAAPQILVSLEDLHLAVEASIGSVLGIEGVPWALDLFEGRAREESQGRWGWDSEERLRYFAVANGFAYAEPLALGKAILLAGPDWLGTFDLSSPEPEETFDREFKRRFGTNR